MPANENVFPSHGTRNLLVGCVLILTVVLSTSCAYLFPKPAGIGKAIGWQDLPGWPHDRHAEAWPALLQSCTKLATRDDRWTAVCAAAAALPAIDDGEARRFFEAWFTPHRVVGRRGKRTGLITGYYEPLLSGSLSPTPRYRYPIYRRPPDLVTVELGELYPELAGKRVRGRLAGSRVLPYPSRGDIHGEQNPLAGQELVWVDDPVALFFLHVQGSGQVRLTNGRTVAVGYADQNGHPYTSIGRELVDMGALKLDEVSLFTIRAWLRQHPDQAETLFNANASYIFFTLRETAADGPVGTLNVALTPERSIAVDRSIIPLGVPVWLDTTLPGAKDREYRRLVFAQDTGGAIKGPLRADLFWGNGNLAERMAGEMKQEGRLYVLLPRSRPVVAAGTR